MSHDIVLMPKRATMNPPPTPGKETHPIHVIKTIYCMTKGHTCHIHKCSIVSELLLPLDYSETCLERPLL